MSLGRNGESKQLPGVTMALSGRPSWGCLHGVYTQIKQNFAAFAGIYTNSTFLLNVKIALVYHTVYHTLRVKAFVNRVFHSFLQIFLQIMLYTIIQRRLDQLTELDTKRMTE